MLNSESTYFGFIVIITISIITWLWTRSRRPKDYPPGPTPIPIIGNLHQMADGDFLTALRKLRKHYGDIFTLSLGKFWVIVVNEADNIRDLLMHKGEYMLDRPPLYVFTFNEHHGIASANGIRWKQHRTFALNKLKSFGFGKKSFESRITEELEMLLASIKEQDGTTLDLNNLINISVSNNIMSIVIGRRFEYDDPRFQYFVELQADNFRNLELAGPLTFLPFLAKLPGDPFGTTQLNKLIQKSKEFHKEEVEQHKKDFDENNIHDFIDAFLKEMKIRENDENNTFTDEQLRSVVGDLFATGTETTSTTIRWCILYLLHHMDVQSKMHKEIEDVVGHGRLPCMSDKSNLPYCEAVIHETLRLGNIVPFAIPYYVTEEFFYKGFRFPKDAVLFLSLDSALSSEDLFPNSHEFQPERFIDTDGNLCGTEKVLAFSTGRRVCLGESLARMELFLYITSLVQRFEFLPPEGEEPPPIEGHLGITYTPLPYKVRVIYRN